MNAPHRSTRGRCPRKLGSSLPLSGHLTLRLFFAGARAPSESSHGARARRWRRQGIVNSRTAVTVGLFTKRMLSSWPRAGRWGWGRGLSAGWRACRSSTRAKSSTGHGNRAETGSRFFPPLALCGFFVFPLFFLSFSSLTFDRHLCCCSALRRSSAAVSACGRHCGALWGFIAVSYLGL